MRDSVYSPGACGMPEPATGREALLQEAYIRLKVNKGAFPYDREMGSLLYRLPSFPEAERDMLARSYSQEALLPLADVQVLGARLIYESKQLCAVEITLELYGAREKVRIDLS